jgi:hypothetical protein
MAAELSQLPGEHEIKDIPPQDVVLSFSETKEEASARAGKQAAGGRLGYWRVLRQSRQPGGSAVYVVDQELQSLLCQIVKDDRPQFVPCAVAGNPVPDPSRPGELTIPDSVMFRRFAWYAGRKPVCHCATEDALNRMATRTVMDGKNKVEKPYPCLGLECPDFIAKKCKRHIVANLYLPWAAGKVAKFRTTSVVSFGSMRSSLLDIANMTGGWLHWLPLEVVWDEELVGEYWVPKIRFRPDSRIAQKMLEEGTRLSALYGQSATQAMQVKRLQEQSRSSIVRFVEDPAEQAAFAQEYHPENKATEAPIIDATFTVETPSEHKPQRLEEPAPSAPEPEPEGEELQLQPPPVAPSQITDGASFQAAMNAIGKGDKKTITEYRKQLGVADMTMNRGAFQQVYRQALSDHEAELAVAS